MNNCKISTGNCKITDDISNLTCAAVDKTNNMITTLDELSIFLFGEGVNTTCCNDTLQEELGFLNVHKQKLTYININMTDVNEILVSILNKLKS